jgi:hypothetical protein
MCEKWYQLHNWEYVYDSYKDTFLGETCEKYYESFRICSRCGKAQEYTFTGFVEMSWVNLDECETKILKSKIEPVFENGKTNWYFKPNENDINK